MKNRLLHKLMLCTVGVGVIYTFYKIPPILADGMYYHKTQLKKKHKGGK